MKFAEMFSSLRRERGLSQRKVANDLNISQALLSHYENGVREPRLDFVVKACDYYGVTSDYMLGISSMKENPYSTGTQRSAAAEALQPGWDSDRVHQLMSAMALALNAAQQAGGEEARRSAQQCIEAVVGQLLGLMNEAAGSNMPLLEKLGLEETLTRAKRELFKAAQGGVSQQLRESISRYYGLLCRSAAADER